MPVGYCALQYLARKGSIRKLCFPWLIVTELARAASPMMAAQSCLLDYFLMLKDYQLLKGIINTRIIQYVDMITQRHDNFSRKPRAIKNAFTHSFTPGQYP